VKADLMQELWLLYLDAQEGLQAYSELRRRRETIITLILAELS